MVSGKHILPFVSYFKLPVLRRCVMKQECSVIVRWHDLIPFRLCY